MVSKILKKFDVKNESDMKQKFVSKGILEDSFIELISCFGLITFNVDSRIFSVSNSIAENVRVIELKTDK